MSGSAAGLAAAQSPDPAAREASCATLFGGTVNSRDLVPFAQIPEVGSLAQWPAAPAGLLPARIFLRGPTDTYNGRYAFATRGGRLYVSHVAGGPDGWREVPLPDCLAGRVASISADDDELVAIDADRRVFTMDNALEGPAAFNWSRRWGLPFWNGGGRTLPTGVLASAAKSGQDDVTWQPATGLRFATVTLKVGDQFVSAGQSLRPSEDRDGKFRLLVGLAWLVSMLVLAAVWFLQYRFTLGLLRQSAAQSPAPHSSE